MLMVRKSVLIVGLLPVLLGACAQTSGGVRLDSSGHITNLSENVLALAAPNQDLTAVRIDPVDGCYIYRHSGPVEVTYIPLRTANGNPICSRAPET